MQWRVWRGYAWHDLVGNSVWLLILGTYFALQTGRLDASAVAYSALNALGAGSITVSLLFDFNLSAFIVEAAWVAVSLLRRLRRRASAHEQIPQRRTWPQRLQLPVNTKPRDGTARSPMHSFRSPTDSIASQPSLRRYATTVSNNRAPTPWPRNSGSTHMAPICPTPRASRCAEPRPKTLASCGAR